MIKELNFTARNGMQIQIPINWGTTWLTGDGATGKSFVFNELEYYASKHALKMFFIKPKSLNYVQMIPNLPDDVFIVVDNFDLIKLRHPEITDYINNCINQCLVIGRDTVGLRMAWEGQLKLVRKGNILTTESIMQYFLDKRNASLKAWYAKQERKKKRKNNGT